MKRVYSVTPVRPSASGVSSLRLSFSGGASVSFGHVSSLLLSWKCILCVLIRTASSRRYLSEHSTYHYFIEDRKEIPEESPFASWYVAVINPQWFELPMSRTNFHGHKDIRAIEVRLYVWPRSTWPHWVDWAVKPQHNRLYVTSITKTRLFKYSENFTTKKIENCQRKK